MIGYLEGSVLERMEDGVILRTSGGVGYQVYLPTSLLATLPSLGDSLHLHTVTVVRDNEISLYGFADSRGKTLFELLVTASGVGPKLALAMLSAFSSEDLKTAIMRQDASLLATIPGIGKKTANRLCIDLADKMGRLGTLPGSGDFTGGGDSGDLVSALTNLGFPEKDVGRVVGSLVGDDSPFEDRLKKAMKQLARQG